MLVPRSRPTAFSIPHGYLLLLCLVCMLVWYQPPIICNPCTWPPTASTGVLVPDEAIGVRVHFDHQKRLVALYPIGFDEMGYGAAYSVDEIPDLIRTAAMNHPGLPVVIKAAEEAPADLILFVLGGLQANGFRNVFFEVQSPR